MATVELNNSSLTDSQQTLRVYGLYRIVLAALILLVFLVQMTTAVENAYRPDLFLYTTGGYFATSVIAHFYAGLRRSPLPDLQVFLFFFLVDIIALTLIAHASGELSTGLSLIMTLTVASSGVLFRDNLAFLVAALASIAVLLNVFFLIRLGVVDDNVLFAAGVLGIVFFSTIFVVKQLVRRIEASQALAARKAQELAYSEYLNQLIVKRMQTGVLVVDGQHQVQSANEAAVALLGLEYNAQNDEDEPLPKPLLASMREWEAAPNVRTRPFRMKAGGALLQSEFMPLTDDDAGKVLIFLEDTTRTRQQAQQIKLASLGRLTASIAHEIRNPLGAISHAAQLLQESSSISSDDERLCEMIVNHSQRLNHTVENVLQLSRRKTSEPERFDIGAWLERFIQIARDADPEVSIRLENALEDQTVSFDPSQLDQVLSNLCSNGLRYSKQQTGRATLTISAHWSLSENLPVVDVIDDGPGVEANLRDQLFEPFATGETGGTGLGLFIAKELCEANQARLDYLPTADKKSCFRITLPHPMKKLAISP